MDKTVHIIWENSFFSNNRINELKMNGMKTIFVLDREQTTIVKERNDVLYFSGELISILKRDEPEKVHHFLIKAPPEKYTKRKKVGKPIIY